MGDDGISLGIDFDVDGTDDAVKLDGALGRLTSGLEQVNRQLVRLELISGRAGHAHGEHEKHAHGLRGALENLVDKGLDPFLHKAKEIAEFEFIREGTEKLLELPGELAEHVKELGEEMLVAAGKAQRMETAFGFAFGEEKAEGILGYIDKLSKASPLAYDQLEQLGLRLGKFGFQGRDAGKALEAVSDMAALSGNPAAGADEALSAIERIKSTGRVEGRALRPFGIDEKTMFAELSKETGLSAKKAHSQSGSLTASQLEKAMQGGKVDVDTILNSVYTVITRKTGHDLGGAGADMSLQFEAQLARMKDLPDRYFRGMAKSPALKVLGDKFGEIFDMFNPKGEQGARIMEALESATTRFANAIADIDLGTTGDVLVDTIDLVGKLAAGTAELVGGLIAGIDKLEEAWIGFKSMLPGQTGRDATEEIRHRYLNKQYRNLQNTANGELKSDEDAMLADFMKRNGLNAAKGLAEGMDAGAEHAEHAGHRLGDRAHRGTKKELGIQSPSRVFADLGLMSGAGFVEGIENSTDGVDRAIARMFDVAAPKGSPAARGGGPPVSIGDVHVHVQVDGGDAESGQDLGDVIGRKLEQILPMTLQSAIEQLALQTGSAQ